MDDKNIPKNSKNKAPSFQFYPTDWMSDPGLSMCSYEAKGLWIDLICFLHEAEPYGHFCINDVPLDEKGIRKLSKMSPKKFKNVWSTLTSFGVVKKSKSGVFYSARMVKDYALRRARSAAGKKGMASRYGYDFDTTSVISNRITKSNPSSPSPSPSSSPPPHNLPEEEGKNKFKNQDVFCQLRDWLDEMDEVQSASGLAKHLFDKYGADACQSAMREPYCTTLGKFHEFASFHAQ